MGAVYEARHLVTGRGCAVKIMTGHAVDRMELRARFRQEARVTAQIRSAYIVDVLDAGIDDALEVPFIVMELLEGDDLAQLLTRRGSLSAAEVVTYLWHVAVALDRMHARGVVHRDLKPRNLFVTSTEDGAPLVKVLDFGIAKMLPRNGTSEHATQNVGTPLYMAPEQFKVDGRVSPATDIYALGMIAYIMLVGAHYWKDEHGLSDNPFAFAQFVSDGPVEAASMRAEREGVELPFGFDVWFHHATAASPDDRFAKATEAVTELALALDVPAPLADPDEITGQSEQPAELRSSTRHALRDTSSGEGRGAATVWDGGDGPSSRSPELIDVITVHDPGGSGSLTVTADRFPGPRERRRRRIALASLAAVLVAVTLLVLLRDRLSPATDRPSSSSPWEQEGGRDTLSGGTATPAGPSPSTAAKAEASHVQVMVPSSARGRAHEPEIEPQSVETLPTVPSAAVEPAPRRKSSSPKPRAPRVQSPAPQAKPPSGEGGRERLYTRD